MEINLDYLKQMLADGRLSVSLAGATCIHCAVVNSAIESAAEHDARCEKHPMAARIAELEAELAEARAALAGHPLWLELAEARKDDTELDATDAAKPAWWRGYDYGVAEICLAAFKAITGEEAKTPVSWRVLKETIAARGAK